jgi:cyclopropane-fatty-acyl-phospholipid synthase
MSTSRMSGFAGLAPAGLPSSGVDRWLGALLLRRFGDAPLRFELGDGTVLLAPHERPVATIVLADRRELLPLVWDPETHFGDAYASGRIDVEGDLVAGVIAAYRAVGRLRRAPWRGHSLRASRANVHRHYDLGNDFYRLWLDDGLVYTCAYFERPEATLEEAQAAKLDYVCRKLRLQPGETVVEAGCGWGALALHMARHYGVRVKAYNLSREQICYAREWAASDGLDRQVEFVEQDYRAIEGRYDAFVSVGMLEHVGLNRFDDLGRVIDRCLDPERGRGLLHFIGRDHPGSLNRWIRKRIFPGAYPPTLSQAAERVLQPARVSILDVENLRLHYARTLSHWRERFEQAVDRVTARYGEPFARAWRLYLAGSEAAFLSGSMQLFQVVFARPASPEIPWTRAGLYSSGTANGEL